MREILLQLCGSTLRGVTEARHWRDGVRDDSDAGLIDLWLHFDDQPALHLTGDPDDDGLLLEHDEPYDSYDLGRYGELRVEPVGSGGPLAAVSGHRLLRAALVSSERGGAHTGVRLRFDHRDLVVLQWGDDFVLALDAVPADLAGAVTVGPWLAPDDRATTQLLSGQRL